MTVSQLSFLRERDREVGKGWRKEKERDERSKMKMGCVGTATPHKGYNHCVGHADTDKNGKNKKHGVRPCSVREKASDSITFCASNCGDSGSSQPVSLSLGLFTFVCFLKIVIYFELIFLKPGLCGTS